MITETDKNPVHLQCHLVFCLPPPSLYTIDAMKLVITHIDFSATNFQVQKAVGDALHGPDRYNTDDPKNKGRVPIS